MAGIVQTLLTTGIITGGVSYAFPRVVSHFFDKRITEFRTQIQAEAARSGTQYKILQERRAEKIASVYQKIQRLSFTFHSLINPVQFDGISIEDKKKRASEAFNEAAEHFRENKIFFGKSLAAELEKLFEKFYKAWLEYQLSQDLMKGENREYLNSWTKAWNSVRDDIPPVLESVESQFRDVIGVSDKR